ncbi:MAG: phenylalanine--tRNA ligase subunit beta [Clostridiales bacterium]|nr:phenylalanine--tRNA ligase subunit beta [Clostridiales bacterium]
MKLSLKWLSEFVKLDTTPKKYIADMTMSGSKVETLEYLGEEIKNVVVGKLLEIKPHENASKLLVCKVDVGADRPIQIVTGADNVREGDIVPVAMDNSLLPGMEIHSGALRGVLSEGMLCSHQELGLTENDVPGAPEHGILILNEYERITIGQDICAVLGFDDYVVDFEITPNRPDCLSVIGLARESAATYGLKFDPPVPVVKGGGGNIDDMLSIRVEDPELCPRYTAKIVKNIKIEPSPKWMREYLRASGVRPINNIVDITNYVMLEYGQPLHSFDYAFLEGKEIVVRRAKRGETMNTLDGQERKLDDSMLVIADSVKPVAVAGVMGGESSEITDKTVDVVFESANFSGVSVRLTSHKLGMRTEASGRFEKGLDSRNTLPAVERACQLCELLCCGQVMDGTIDIDNANYSSRVLKLEAERVNKFIGIDIPREQMVNYLDLLGFEIIGDNITVPSWREDVEHFADIAEEVARMYGYNVIPTTLFSGATTYRTTPVITFEDELKSCCRSIGYSEAMTYSFVSPKSLDRILAPEESELRYMFAIANPLSEEMSVMRRTLIPSIVEVMARNINVKNTNPRVFELGKIYIPEVEDNKVVMSKRPLEKRLLAIAGAGDYDFFALKGAVEYVAKSFGLGRLSYVQESNYSAFHPGRCAKVYVGDVYLGVLGELHPTVLDNYNVASPIYVAELDSTVIFDKAAGLPLYTPLPRFPGSERDIAVVCDESVPVSQIEQCIIDGAGALLDGFHLFDVYRGAQVGKNKKSVAYALRLRASDRTLTDADSEGVMAEIIELLSERLDAVIRS